MSKTAALVNISGAIHNEFFGVPLGKADIALSDAGFKAEIQTSWLGNSRSSLTCGVLPIVSRIDVAFIFALPSIWFPRI